MSDNIIQVMNCVRDIYRNCASILLAADILMEERGFSRYSWAHFYDRDPIDGLGRGGTVLNLRNADGLVTGMLFHQYYADGQKDRDIVTICTAPWRRNPTAYRPVCCATRFCASATPDEVYLIGTSPVWQEKNKFDGRVYHYDINSTIWEKYSDVYAKVVATGTKVAALAIPLEEVASSDVLAKRLVDPLLAVVG